MTDSDGIVGRVYLNLGSEASSQHDAFVDGRRFSMLTALAIALHGRGLLTTHQCPAVQSRAHKSRVGGTMLVAPLSRLTIGSGDHHQGHDTMSPVAKTRGMNSTDSVAGMTAPVSRRLNTARLSRHQLKDKIVADALAMKLKWKTLIEPAKSTWPRLHTEDLLRVEGDFHRLAGLVQLRHQLDREESDRQVRAFFTTHDAVS